MGLYPFLRTPTLIPYNLYVLRASCLYLRLSHPPLSPCMDTRDDKPFPFLEHLDIPPPWEAAAQRFLKAGDVTLVLGGPDTGKSTLCRYLVYRAYIAGEPVALVDLDLGQSHLGPPGALGLGLFPPRFPGDQSLFPEALYFIGQTSPVGAVLEVAVGCRVLMDEARALGVNLVVFNTSGLIHGPAACRLKMAQMELLQPQLLLALEREGELAPLRRVLDGETRTLSLPVSFRATRKTMEERRRNREAKFRRYFERAQRRELSLAQVVWQGHPFGWGKKPLAPGELSYWSKVLGEEVLFGTAAERTLVLLLDRPVAALPLPEPLERLHLLPRSTLEHRLTGLWDKDYRTLALGLLLPSPWAEGRLHIWTPLPAAEMPRVRSLSLGRLKVSLTGRELPPGPD